MSGRSGNPHLATNLMWNYMYLLAMGLQRAGPTLTPLSYEYGVLTMPGYDSWAQRHDPRVLHILFQRGDYTALSDVREVYWDPNRRSPINGAQGGYVALNGGHRLKIGEIPIGPPPLPASFG
jgi:hypothetical protein